MTLDRHSTQDREVEAAHPVGGDHTHAPDRGQEAGPGIAHALVNAAGPRIGRDLARAPGNAAAAAAGAAPTRGPEHHQGREIVTETTLSHEKTKLIGVVHQHL